MSTIEAETEKALGMKPKKAILTVSHKDHNRMNNEDSNLQTLCTVCHLNYDREFSTLKRKMGRMLKESEAYVLKLVEDNGLGKYNGYSYLKEEKKNK